MQGFSVNLTNDCDENQLNYNNDLPAIGNKNYALPILHSNSFFSVKLFYREIHQNEFSDIYLNCRIHLLRMKIQFCQF